MAGGDGVVRDQVKQCIQGCGSRAGFVPWIYAISAKIRVTTLEKMAASAVEMSLAVIDSVKLFRQEVVSVNLDPTVWLEAMGCEIGWGVSGPAIIAVPDSLPNPEDIADADRVRVVLEAIDRVRGSLPPGKLIGCGMVGPATLARSLGLGTRPDRSEEFMVGEFVTEAVRSICSKPIDLLVLMEDEHVGSDDLGYWSSKGHYAAVQRMAHYFSVAVILLARSVPNIKGDEPGLNEYDGLVAGIPGSWYGAEGHEKPLKGIVVPGFGTGSCRLDQVESFLEEGCFLTHTWDVASGTDLGDLQRDIAAINSFLRM